MITFVHVLQGESPLWIASFYGHLEVVKTLIEAGANVNQADKVCVCSDIFILLSSSISYIPYLSHFLFKFLMPVYEVISSHYMLHVVLICFVL